MAGRIKHAINQPYTRPSTCLSVCVSVHLCVLQKCLRLDPELPVWTSKQRVLVTLTQSLSDVLNYGLFQPAFNGRAGKFLDEERLLKEYPLPPITPIPYLEVSLHPSSLLSKGLFLYAGKSVFRLTSDLNVLTLLCCHWSSGTTANHIRSPFSNSRTKS